VWAEKGKSVLVRLADDDPGKFATIAYGVLPRDMLLRVEESEPSPFEHLSPDQKRQLAAMLTAKVIEGSSVPLTCGSAEADEVKSST
jgi:hypothetical protein